MTGSMIVLKIQSGFFVSLITRILTCCCQKSVKHSIAFKKQLDSNSLSGSEQLKIFQMSHVTLFFTAPHTE